MWLSSEHQCIQLLPSGVVPITGGYIDVASAVEGRGGGLRQRPMRKRAGHGRRADELPRHRGTGVAADEQSSRPMGIKARIVEAQNAGH